MPRGAVKVFDIVEYLIDNGGYKIQVMFRGEFVEEFTGKNFAIALAKLKRAGYRMGNDSSVGFDYETS